MWLINLTIVLLLILANGIFAMTELALLSSKKSKLQQYADDGKNPLKSPSTFWNVRRICCRRFKSALP
ncbi:hypothetical protein [Exiguobacterium artemiae]